MHLLISMLGIIIGTTSSCQTQERPFQAGKDHCHMCKMTIMDTRFGAQLITQKGKLFLFDDVVCLAGFIKTDFLEKKDIRKIVVADYVEKDKLIAMEKAWFYVSPEIKSPMGGQAAAFDEKSKAESVGTAGKMMNWIELQSHFN